MLRRVFPDADVPVFQLGIDIGRPGPYHYELASRLKVLRDRGVLVVGRGNIVHNLGMVVWDRLDGDPYGFDWALEFDALVKRMIGEGRDRELADWRKLGKAAALAIPTADHYLPLLYALALRDRDEEVAIFNELPVGGSLTMTSYRFG